MRVDKIVVFVM